jgi:hypothetical protein
MQSIENELEKNINLVSEKSVKNLLKSKMEVKKQQLQERLAKHVFKS